MKLIAVILAFDEEVHLRRCCESLAGVVDGILVMDCYSTDATVAIAQEYGARVLQKDWVNYASQFNYALTQLRDDYDWVLRIDADEYLTPQLAKEIKEKLPVLPYDVEGVYLPRRMAFMGRLSGRGWGC